jgi:hypothetical protein
MISFNKKTLFACLIVFAANAGSSTITNEKFPYRVVCTSDWVQQERNDTLLVLDKTTSEKKTRFQLKKYDVDSGFDKETKEWSRFRYFVNHTIISQFGKIIFVDTAASKKLGGYRAYEIFAFFWEKTDETTLWLAEYVRWTDNNGFGYMASIIGDTLDMKENIRNKSYVQFLDSIILSQASSSNRVYETGGKKMIIKAAAAKTPVWFDVLGRSVQEYYCQKPKTIIVKQNTKHSITR